MSQTEIKRVHLLTGDDTVGRERAKQRILGSITELHGQVVSEKYDHGKGEFQLFLESIFTPSLFQEIRVFQINHAQNLSDAELDRLDKMLDTIPPDAYLIIEIDEEKKGSKGESKVAKKLHVTKRSKSGGQCVLMEFPKPPEYRLAQWLVSQVPMLFGRQISKADADYLIDLAGADIDMLYSELQKIDIHLPPGVPVDHRVIEEIVGASRQMTVFELAAALSGRNFPRALQIIDSLFTTSFYGPVMVSALYRQFWALFRIRQFAESNPQVVKRFLNSRGFNNPDQNETAFLIGKAAGLLRDGEQRKVYPVIIQSGIVQQARSFTDEELLQILRWLLEFDYGIKTGRIDDSQQNVQMFCYKLARVRELMRDGAAA